MDIKDNAPLDLKPGDTARVSARVHRLKRSRKMVFVYLALRGELVKTVYTDGLCEKSVSLLDEGMFIRADIRAAAEIKADNGIELRLEDFEILSSPSAAYPISISDAGYNHSLETTIENKPLTLRHPQISAVYKIQSQILGAFEDLMRANDFTRIVTPMISEYSEKPSFEIDYYGKKAYLPYSPQLYMTAATASLDRTYCVSPSFLAKKYNSSRHLAEFTSLSFQLGYIKTIDSVIGMLTSFLKAAAKFGSNINIPDEIPIYGFGDALKILGKDNQPDLDPTDIKRLCAREKERSGSDFVCVTGFPPDKRPFYAEDFSGFDIYLNGWTISSGSKNIYNYKAQLEKAARLGIDPAQYTAYFDALKYGIMPYGGCTTGLERLTAALLRLDNVKYAALFTRDLHHIKP